MSTPPPAPGLPAVPPPAGPPPVTPAAAPPTPASAPPPAGPGTVVLRVVGLAVVLALLPAGTVAIVSEFFEQERSESTSYSGVRTVVTDTSTGSVEVRAGALGSQVRVDRRLSWSFVAPAATSTVDGDTLRLEGDCDQGWTWGDCSVDYDITVPPGTALDIRSATGAVEVQGTDGDLSVTTSTGSLELTGLRSPNVDARSSTGSLELTFVDPPTRVTATTSTGSVEVVLPDDGTRYRVDARTSVGSREVQVPSDPGSDRTIDARTSVGSVEVRLDAPTSLGSLGVRVDVP